MRYGNKVLKIEDNTLIEISTVLMSLQSSKIQPSWGFRPRTGYRLTGTGSVTGSLKLGGLLAARSATGLGGGTSVSMLLAAVCSLASLDSQTGVNVLRSG